MPPPTSPQEKDALFSDLSGLFAGTRTREELGLTTEGEQRARVWFDAESTRRNQPQDLTPIAASPFGFAGSPAGAAVQMALGRVSPNQISEARQSVSAATGAVARFAGQVITDPALRPGQSGRVILMGADQFADVAAAGLLEAIGGIPSRTLTLPEQSRLSQNLPVRLEDFPLPGEPVVAPAEPTIFTDAPPGQGIRRPRLEAAAQSLRDSAETKQRQIDELAAAATTPIGSLATKVSAGAGAAALTLPFFIGAGAVAGPIVGAAIPGIGRAALAARALASNIFSFGGIGALTAPPGEKAAGFVGGAISAGPFTVVNALPIGAAFKALGQGIQAGTLSAIQGASIQDAIANMLVMAGLVAAAPSGKKSKSAEKAKVRINGKAAAKTAQEITSDVRKAVDVERQVPPEKIEGDVEAVSRALEAPFEGQARPERATATFIGLQERPSGEPIALFNISGGERSGSTVSARTLEQLGIPVPAIPEGVQVGEKLVLQQFKTPAEVAADHSIELEARQKAIAVEKENAFHEIYNLTGAKTPADKAIVVEKLKAATGLSPDSLDQSVRAKFYDAANARLGDVVQKPQHLIRAGKKRLALNPVKNSSLWKWLVGRGGLKDDPGQYTSIPGKQISRYADPKKGKVTLGELYERLQDDGIFPPGAFDENALRQHLNEGGNKPYKIGDLNANRDYYETVGQEQFEAAQAEAIRVAGDQAIKELNALRANPSDNIVALDDYILKRVFERRDRAELPKIEGVELELLPSGKPPNGSVVEIEGKKFTVDFDADLDVIVLRGDGVTIPVAGTIRVDRVISRPALSAPEFDPFITGESVGAEAIDPRAPQAPEFRTQQLPFRRPKAPDFIDNRRGEIRSPSALRKRARDVQGAFLDSLKFNPETAAVGQRLLDSNSRVWTITSKDRANWKLTTDLIQGGEVRIKPGEINKFLRGEGEKANQVNARINREMGEFFISADEAFQKGFAEDQTQARVLRARNRISNRLKRTMPKVWPAIRRHAWDSRGDVAVALTKELGKQGQIVNATRDAFDGVDFNSASRFQELEVGVYGKLKGMKEQVQFFSFLNNLRISKDLRGRLDVQHTRGLLPKEAELALEKFTKGNPERAAKFRDLVKKRQALMDRFTITRLQETGVLSAEEANALRAENPNYVTRAYLDKLNLAENELKVDSTREIQKGSIGDQLPDAPNLDRRAILLTELAVLKNRMLREIFDGLTHHAKDAENVKGDPFGYMMGKGDAVPQGKGEGKSYTEVEFKFDGEPKRMALDAKLYKQLVDTTPILQPDVARLIRTLSGSAMLKWFVTGSGNPLFSLVNFPRDIANLYLRSAPGQTAEYNSLLPRFLAQHTIDLVQTFNDVRLQKGFFRELARNNAFAEGFGESADIFKQPTFGEPAFIKAFRAFQKWSGWATNFGERWVRTAVAHRSIKNGKSITEAAYDAMSTINFHKSGTTARVLNNAVPYFTAGIAGSRGLFQSFAAAPGRFAFKAAQLGAIAAGVYLQNTKKENRHLYATVSDAVKRNNWVIMTGWTIKDARGNDRAFYFKIPKDPGQRAISALTDYTIGKSMGHRVDLENAIVGAGAVVAHMEMEAVPIPTLKAMAIEKYGLNLYTGEKLFKRREVDPAAQTYPGAVPEIYTVLGEKFDVSPMSMKAMVDSYLGTSGPYRHGADALLNKILDVLPAPERERAQMDIYAEMVTQLPGLKSFTGLGAPVGAFRSEFEESQVPENTRRKLQSEEMQRLAIDYENSLGRLGGDHPDTKALREAHVSFLKDQVKNFPADRQRLSQYNFAFMATRGMDKRAFWTNMKMSSPVVQGRMWFYVQHIAPHDQDLPQIWIDELVAEQGKARVGMGVLGTNAMAEYTKLKKMFKADFDADNITFEDLLETTKEEKTNANR